MIFEKMGKHVFLAKLSPLAPVMACRQMIKSLSGDTTSAKLGVETDGSGNRTDRFSPRIKRSFAGLAGPGDSGVSGVGEGAGHERTP